METLSQTIFASGNGRSVYRRRNCLVKLKV